MRFLLSTGLTYRVMSIAQTEQMALNLGYNGLEYMIQSGSKSARQIDGTWSDCRHIEAVHAPFSIPGLQWYTKSINRAVVVAKETGAKLIVAHPPSLRWFLGGRFAQEIYLSIIKDIELNEGITIAVEVLPKAHGSRRQILKTWIQQPFKHPLDWIKRIEDFKLNACLDTTHLGTWQENPTEYISEISASLKHVHLSDFNSDMFIEHVVVGDGTLRMASILDLLHLLTPDITVTVELAAAATTNKAHFNAQRSIDYIKNHLP